MEQKNKLDYEDSFPNSPGWPELNNVLVKGTSFKSPHSGDADK